MQEDHPNMSDLQLANLLSRKLSTREEKTIGQTLSAQELNAYVGLDQGNPFLDAVAEPVAVDGEETATEADVALEGLQDWQQLMHWCLELTGAESAFVVDRHGFVVASAGQDSRNDDFEGVGAELCYAMEQLDRLHPDNHKLKAVSLKFDDCCIFSFRAVEADVEEVFVIGVVSAEALPRESQRTVFRVANANLAQFL